MLAEPPVPRRLGAASALSESFRPASLRRAQPSLRERIRDGKKSSCTLQGTWQGVGLETSDRVCKMRLLRSQLWFLGCHGVLQGASLPAAQAFPAEVRWAEPLLASVWHPARCWVGWPSFALKFYCTQLPSRVAGGCVCRL